jgi:hypothetical protein
MGKSRNGANRAIDSATHFFMTGVARHAQQARRGAHPTRNRCPCPKISHALIRSVRNAYMVRSGFFLWRGGSVSCVQHGNSRECRREWSAGMQGGGGSGRAPVALAIDPGLRFHKINLRSVGTTQMRDDHERCACGTNCGSGALSRRFPNCTLTNAASKPYACP